VEPEYDPESGSKNKETLTERRHQVWSPRNRNTPTTFGGGIRNRNTPTTFGGGIRNTPTTFGGGIRSTSTTFGHQE